MNAPVNRVYEFGPFRLNPDEGVLLRQGQEVPLTPKAYEILLCLLQHAGHILGKDALMHEIWPDTFVEEGNLKANISVLRRALGDTTEEPAYIETIPRRGYRFVAQVRAGEPPSSGLVVGGPARLTIERHTLAHSVTEEEEFVERPGNGTGHAPALPDIAPAALPAVPQPLRRSRRWLWAGVVAVVALLVAAGTVVYFSRLPGDPVRVTLTGRKLQAWDANEHLAWEYEFAEPMEIATMAERESIRFADLRGDGHRELLAPLAYPSDKREVDLPHSALFCFSDRGKLLWSYDPDVKFRFAGEEFAGPWSLQSLTLVREGEKQSVWVAFDHLVWWPSFVARISPDGAAEIRFLNSGRIRFLKEMRTSGGTYLLAAGINNESMEASIAVVAANEGFALSPQGQGRRYYCESCEQHIVPFYLLFSRSEIFQLQGAAFHIIDGLDVTSDGFSATTYEGKDEAIRPLGINLNAFYSISGDLQKFQGTMGDTYWNLHRRLEREGKIHHSVEACPDQKIAGRIRIFTRSTGWSSPGAGARKTASPPAH